MPADISGRVSPRVSPMDSPRVSLPANPSAGPVEDLHTGCSESADDVAETTSDDHMAIVDALMTNQVQHAAVDQVLDNLLAEVSAPLQAVQSSMPADTSGRVSPMVSLPANCFAPQQAGSLPAVPTPDSRCVSSTTHSQPLPPFATAAKRSSAELALLVPPSSSSGKENIPVVGGKSCQHEQGGEPAQGCGGCHGQGQGQDVLPGQAHIPGDGSGPAN